MSGFIKILAIYSSGLSTAFDFLKRLQNNGLIRTKPVSIPDTYRTPTRTPISLITICNYECDPKEQIPIRTPVRQLPDSNPDETEEEKNIKEDIRAVAVATRTADLQSRKEEKGTSEIELGRERPSSIESSPF